MYIYDNYDQQLLNERVAQFREQTARYLDGGLSESEFLPLRLQNGLYIQRLAPMFRIAVPYGLLASKQLRKLAYITRHFDKGYAHFTTRQNVQLNWPELQEVPDILAELASVQMHANQTSGNCIRNTTSDQFAGVAKDEYLDPRPYCELIRQWSTYHPEFAFLPRKFKIAVCGSEEDRAAIRIHDIGVELKINAQNEVGYKVLVGGGLGRTPVIGEEICDFLPEKHLLTYLTAILRVYNQFGRRDNKFKARIKILVRAMGIDAFREQVEKQWATLKDQEGTLTQAEIERVRGFFPLPDYQKLDDTDAELALQSQAQNNQNFANWLSHNTQDHKQAGYRAVTVSMKFTGVAPGDISESQLDLLADLADQYSFGEVRVTHHQNVVLADIKKSDLFAVWQILDKAKMATANIGTLTDMICCPGGDFCSLANAKSLPVAEQISRRFDNLDYLYDLGPIELNISGCMNACGHHHVGHIGVLGVDKKGQEFFQISLGGNQSKDEGALAKILGPSFKADEVPDVIEKLLNTYVAKRTDDNETFLDCYKRIGIQTFKEAVYA